MCFPKTSIVFVTIICGLFFTTVQVQQSDASPILLKWSGEVLTITSFHEDAVPAGIQIGSQITGSLSFETDQYNSSSSIMGTDVAGNEYRFIEGLHQVINIENWQWIIYGADVSLLQTYWGNNPAHAFGTHSTSETHNYDVFPNYVGRFEYSIGFYDEEAPLQLFNSTLMDNLVFSPEAITSGRGHLTTRMWDDQGNIVDGYYITYKVTSVVQGYSYLLWTK